MREVEVFSIPGILNTAPTEIYEILYFTLVTLQQ